VLRDHAHGILIAGTFSQAAVDRMARNPNTLCPLGDAHRQPVSGELSVGRSVARLLYVCRPPTIRAAVVRATLFAFATPVAVVVSNTIKRVQLRRSAAHVFQESFESSPPLARLDAAPTVTRIVGCVLVGASIPHLRPTRVLSRTAHTVRGEAFGTQCSSTAATGCGGAAAQRRNRHRPLFPAHAPAPPSQATRTGVVVVSDRSKDNDRAEPSVSEIVRSWWEIDERRAFGSHARSYRAMTPERKYVDYFLQTQIPLSCIATVEQKSVT